uniref:N-acetylmuramoyl-L-alanine amidase n=1 Tax=Peptostreptococcus faecalis TaxID=2045015 RepID=UPI0015E13D8A
NVPFNRNTWHCGATYGNRNYIGIEIAKSTGNALEFAKAERNAVKYVASILKKYGWGIDRVETHQKQSGKYCPHKTLDLGWQRFLNMINEELNGQKTIINNILNKPEIKANYSVQVSVGKGETLNVRSQPSANAKVVNAYNDGSVIYVEAVARDEYNNAWYKIPKMGYVSAAYCKGIDNRPKIVLYYGDGDKPIAELIASKYKVKCYRDDGTRTKKDYNIMYVGGKQYKDRYESAKVAVNAYL